MVLPSHKAIDAAIVGSARAKSRYVKYLKIRDNCTIKILHGYALTAAQSMTKSHFQSGKRNSFSNEHTENTLAQSCKNKIIVYKQEQRYCYVAKYLI